MNIFIIKPKQTTIEYTLYSTKENGALLTGSIGMDESGMEEGFSLQEIAKACREKLTGSEPDAVAIYGRYGGCLFPETAPVNDEVVQKLKRLVPAAPLHVPSVIMLCEETENVFPGTPAFLVFGTSFFCRLPERESYYGISDLEEGTSPRRFGYHGLYHEAACRMIQREQIRPGEKKRARVLSICLEPQPELTAISGLVPQMVTSGATPLEGLPGLTSCGEIDPAVALVLAETAGLGPEQIDSLLTRESGLRSLCGCDAGLDEILTSEDEKMNLARDVFLYRILLAAGAGVAAMGGADAVVFSGRYAEAGKVIEKRLMENPLFKKLKEEQGMQFKYMKTPIEEILAQKTGAALAVLEKSPA